MVFPCFGRRRGWRICRKNTLINVYGKKCISAMILFIQVEKPATNPGEGRENMIRVLLIMQRRIMSDAIKRSLSDEAELQFFINQDYKNIGNYVQTYKPDITLVEIPESKASQPKEYLDICAGIRQTDSRCRLLLMCPENSGESKQAAVEGVRSGILEDFIFYDVSTEYLKTKLKALGANNTNQDI